MKHQFDIFDTVEIVFNESQTPFVHTILNEAQPIRGFVMTYVVDLDSNTVDAFYIYNKKYNWFKISKIHSIVMCNMVLVEKYDLKMFETFSKF